MSKCIDIVWRVKAGWYVIADPGKKFEVAISPLHGRRSVIRTVGIEFEVVIAHMKVEGKETENEDKVFERNRFDQWCSPYFKEYLGNDYESIPRKFQFDKRTTPFEDDVETFSVDAGKIEVTLEKANYRKILGWKLGTIQNKRGAIRKNSNAANMETSLKRVLSVEHSGDGGKRYYHGFVSLVKFKNRGMLPEKITIFVRKRNWLKSHRIIDSQGNPY